MFLINVKEALGYSHEQTLNSSLSLINAMLSEYSYMWYERNREPNEDENGEFEWVELPDWDNPAQINRIKKYKDVGGFISRGKV